MIDTKYTLKSRLTALLLIALFITGCDFQFPTFTNSESGSKVKEGDEGDTDSFAYEMLNLQYLEGGAESILRIENFKEISKTKVDGGFGYHVQYDLVFHADADTLAEELNQKSTQGTDHTQEVQNLISQFGRFRPGTRIPKSEHIYIVRGKRGLEVQRY